MAEVDLQGSPGDEDGREDTRGRHTKKLTLCTMPKNIGVTFPIVHVLSRIIINWMLYERAIFLFGDLTERAISSLTPTSI